MRRTDARLHGFFKGSFAVHGEPASSLGKPLCTPVETVTVLGIESRK